jgi:hypothetical protein
MHRLPGQGLEHEQVEAALQQPDIRFRHPIAPLDHLMQY